MERNTTEFYLVLDYDEDGERLLSRGLGMKPEVFISKAGAIRFALEKVVTVTPHAKIKFPRVYSRGAVQGHAIQVDGVLLTETMVEQRYA